MKKTTFAVIVGNRGFFPDHLAKSGRKDIIDVLKEAGYGTIALSMQDTKYGAVETFADAKKCAELFAKNAAQIDGIIVTLPNFGDEKGVTGTIERSGLDVPILIQFAGKPGNNNKLIVVLTVLVDKQGVTTGMPDKHRRKVSQPPDIHREIPEDNNNGFEFRTERIRIFRFKLPFWLVNRFKKALRLSSAQEREMICRN